MSKAPDLFTSTSYASLADRDLKLEVLERVVKDHFITIDEVRFDADDLYTTLCEVDDGGVTTDFERAQTEVLKKYGILESEGSQRWMMSARLGPFGKNFLERLELLIFGKE